MAVRGIPRELGLVAVSPQWSIPERTLGVEWEHRDELGLAACGARFE
jgi:hypothetical protein